MQVILLIIAVSVDVFVACVACGSEQIKIGSAAALCISTVCSGILGISLYAGMALQGVLLKKYALYLSFFGLLAVGIFKLTEYAIRKYIERHKFLCKKVKISFSQLSFILSIYNNRRCRVWRLYFLHLQCHWTGCLEDLVQDLAESIFFLRCLEVLSSVSVQYFADAGLACRHLSGGKPMYRGLEACCL